MLNIKRLKTRPANGGQSYFLLNNEVTEPRTMLGICIECLR